MKLYRLLRTLSKEEWKLLKKATQSAIFTPHSKAGKLVDVLAKQAPDFDDSPGAKRKLFKKVFLKEVFSDSKLRQLFSNLTKLVEQVLLFQAQEIDTFDKQKRLNKVYQERGLNHLFELTTADLLKQLEKRTHQDVHYHQDRFDLLYNMYFHPLHDKYDLKDDTLGEAASSLNIFYAVYQLRVALASISRSQVLNETPDLQVLNLLKKQWQEGLFENNVLIEVYLRALTLLETEMEENFHNFEYIFFNKIKQFPTEDQKFLFMSGLNYSIKQKNKGKENYEHTPYKWLKFGLSNDLLIHKEVMAEATFANMVINGCHKQDFDWVLDFIETYKSFLPREVQEAAAIYYKSLVYYFKGEWDETLSIIHKNEHQPIFQPRSRMITIRALFEKFLLDNDNWELLLSNLNAFEAYLRRNEYIAKEKILFYKNFILITRQLVNKINRKESASHIKNWFKSYIEKNSNITAKNWLSEKVNQL